MRAAVITANYDNYDIPKPICPQARTEVEWIFVTDSEEDVERSEALGWTAVYEPRPDVHPNRAAKRPKMLPWKYTDAVASVWIDASYRVVSPTFVADVLAVANPIAQFVHPWRNCIYAEAAESNLLPKYKGQPCVEQVTTYEALGMPPDWGLWATGVIARYHTPQVIKFGGDWYTEILNWSFQDQLSHPFALWMNDLYPIPLKGTHLVNPWLRYEGSARH